MAGVKTQAAQSVDGAAIFMSQGKRRLCSWP
jgi:hypothetical protein